MGDEPSAPSQRLGGTQQDLQASTEAVTISDAYGQPVPPTVMALRRMVG